MMWYSMEKAVVMLLSNLKIYLLIIVELACMEGVLVLCDATRRSAGSEVERLSEIYRDQEIYITYYPVGEVSGISWDDPGTEEGGTDMAVEDGSKVIEDGSKTVEGGNRSVGIGTMEPEAAGITFDDFKALRESCPGDVTLQYYVCDQVTTFDDGAFDTLFILWGSEEFFRRQLGKDYPAGSSAGYVGQDAAALLARQTVMLIPDPEENVSRGDSPDSIIIEGTEHRLEPLDRKGGIPAASIEWGAESSRCVALPIGERPENWAQTNVRTVLSVSFEEFGDASEQVQQMISVLYERHGGRFRYSYSDVLSEYEDRVEEILDELSMFSFIARMCLCVAFFGIAGIMALLVRRRRKEYAISHAVGARRRNIFVELLTEIFLVSAAGSALGSILGFCLTFRQPQSAFRVRFYPATLLTPVLIALAIPLLTGLIILPDVNSVNPIETIKDE